MTYKCLHTGDDFELLNVGNDVIVFYIAGYNNNNNNNDPKAMDILVMLIELLNS